MKVELLRYTPDGEKLIAAAAKLCYSSVGVAEIEEDLGNDEVIKFLEILTKLGHESPIEHISFTFGVEGVSRTLSHQLVRHRIASYSQQSQRYVKLDQFEYITPPEIAKNDSTKHIFEEQMYSAHEAYHNLFDILYSNEYERLFDLGLNQKKCESMAEKTAIEDARYVFPNACETKIVFTMNARTLLNFFSLRCCNRAQWEIRKMAIEMLMRVKEVSPTIFALAGPGCIKGACPEGTMTCGKMNEVRKFFKGK